MDREPGPLYGKRILNPRAAGQARSYSGQIRQRGGIPVDIPLIQVSEPEDTALIRETIDCLGDFDWIVLTSKNGVRYFSHFLKKYSGGKAVALPKIAAVGSKTKEAVLEAGWAVDLIPEKFVAESLAEELIKWTGKNSRVLLARGNLARDVLPEALQAGGCEVLDIIFYKTDMNHAAKPQLEQAVMNGEIDIFTFTSSSTVSSFIELLKDLPADKRTGGKVVACIGPIASGTAEKLGLKVDVIPETYTASGLLDALEAYCG
ncbi:uroporphyrinogen-III synthase [Bacillus marinisedimentorum]|uniref:uroporphyrinogen-III synthase n=1 Tax=Bacillus marinisedimentorum TaxID=1821260 RepID=UPI00087301EF|nr:uroporphyrinogen-III synthase [Bacillus marinisedimentorum]